MENITLDSGHPVLDPQGHTIRLPRQAIIKLRKALGDDAHDPKYIETISKRGYRLIAPVERVQPSIAQARVSRHKRLALIAAVPEAAALE